MLARTRTDEIELLRPDPGGVEHGTRRDLEGGSRDGVGARVVVPMRSAEQRVTIRAPAPPRSARPQTTSARRPRGGRPSTGGRHGAVAC